MNHQPDPNQMNNQAPPPPSWGQVPPPPMPAQSGDILFAFLGFFFPLVGLTLYIIWLNTYPYRAKCAGIGALVSVIVTVVSILIALIILAVYLIIAAVIVGVAV